MAQVAKLERTRGGGESELLAMIVDRQEGGTENLAAHGVKLHSVFVGDDFR
jgi:orotate phosphoribosyltransferase